MKSTLRVVIQARSFIKKYYGTHRIAVQRSLCKKNLQPKSNVRYFCKSAGEENQVVCNVGTIGHVDHGKTTLTAAITKYVHEQNKACKYVPYNEIDKAPEEKKRGITINIAHIGYATKKRQYAHTDCPGHVDFVKNMISGASQMEGAILLVAADDGPMPQTKEHLLLAKQIGIGHIIVYINKADLADPEILELVEIETRELLTQYGYDGLSSPVIFGSALLALNGDTSTFGMPSIKLLLDALDNHIPNAERDYSSPFILPIDNVFTVPGRGTVAVGTLKRGTIKKNMEAELLGFDEKLRTTVTDIQIFRKSVLLAQAGQNIGVLLRGIKLSSARRGMIVAQSGSLKLSNHFEAQLYLLSTDEGGRKKPLPVSGFCTTVHSSTWTIYCRFDFLLPPGSSMLMPGEHTTTRITFLNRMPVIEGQVFTVREHKATVATGIITKICQTIPINKTKMNLTEIPDLKNKSSV